MIIVGLFLSLPFVVASGWIGVAAGRLCDRALAAALTAGLVSALALWSSFVAAAVALWGMPSGEGWAELALWISLLTPPTSLISAFAAPGLRRSA
jgi:hypothetical protein